MPTDESDRALLRRVPLFAELSEEDFSWVAEGGAPVELAAGDLLVGEGEPGDALFVIVSGELEVVKRSRTTDVPIAVLVPGEVVGEMAIFEAQPRMASVRAVSPTQGHPDRTRHDPRAAQHPAFGHPLDAADRDGSSAQYRGDAQGT